MTAAAAAAAMLDDHEHLRLHFHNTNSTCDRHPDVPVTGFCASCLRERLQDLETATNNRGRPSRATSSAIRSIFSRNHPSSSSSSSSFRPGLRRCNSFSATGPRAVTASAFEPQRRSCDVRGRNTLWSLIHQEQQGSDARAVSEGIGTECRNVGVLPSTHVPEPPQQQDHDNHQHVEHLQDVMMKADEILEETQQEQRIQEDDEVEKNVSANGAPETEEIVKPTKEQEYIDFHTNHGKRASSSKDLKEIAGSFWLAASVFSKKLQNWRRKQKLKKQQQQQGGKPGAMHRTENVPGMRPRRLFETQSEVALDVLGRRMSCDVDPRFSLDGGRLSFDDPRGSWDEPRASWDGYLFGGRSVFSSRLPSMLEDVSVTGVVQRSDGLIPVEEDITMPGGTTQTREYYMDSSQRRRRSLDRSSSVKRPAANEVEDPRVGGPKYQSAHVNGVHKSEREAKDWNSSSMRHDRPESFEYQKGGPPPSKKSRLWSKAWNLWGFIQRRSSGRNTGRGVERSMSECWTELRVTGGDGRVRRSNSSLSSRYSCGNANGMRKSGNCNIEVYGHSMKRRDEGGWERNREERRDADEGAPTPTSGWPRRGGGPGKSRHRSCHPLARSVMELY